MYWRVQVAQCESARPPILENHSEYSYDVAKFCGTITKSNRFQFRFPQICCTRGVESLVTRFPVPNHQLGKIGLAKIQSFKLVKGLNPRLRLGL